MEIILYFYEILFLLTCFVKVNSNQIKRSKYFQNSFSFIPIVLRLAELLPDQSFDLYGSYSFNKNAPANNNIPKGLILIFYFQIGFAYLESID